ncbi:MAG: hypothetical protein IJE63_03395 [Clostridia bacterium]|nr:hypothetical protein [Clostridia bacterium]
MKKLLALILAGAMLFAFAACGGNSDNGETTTQAPVAQVDVADATDLLTKVWASFGDDEKPFVMGGYGDTMVDGAPGKFDVSLAEDIDAMLGLPAANVADIDDAASVIHAMNANTFTCAAFHLNAGVDAAAFVDALKANLQARQWMCGIPEKILIVTVGDYVVSAFGAADILDNLNAKLGAQFSAAAVVVDEPIA